MRWIMIYLFLIGPLLLLGFASGVIMIIGARKMMRLESHRWGTVASVMALLPLSPANLVGIGVAIWSLVVLNRPSVKAAFNAMAKSEG